MSIINVYERAYARHEMEKEAEAVVEAYGTADGYLPEAYFGAFMEMEKEAHTEAMVSTFAPETGYIPARYVSALEKDAGFTQMVQSSGQALMRGGRSGMKTLKQSGAVNKVDGKWALTENAGLGDAAKFYWNQGKRQLGAQMIQNPGATMAVGGLGAAGVGYGGYRMMGGGQG